MEAGKGSWVNSREWFGGNGRSRPLMPGAFAILFYMSIGFAGYYRYICMVLTVRKAAKETGHCCRESRGEGTRRESLKYEESDNHCDQK